MKCAVVYTEERLKVNEYFARALCSYLSADLVDESVGEEYDCYVFRCENSEKRLFFEERGKLVVNNALTGKIANDKHLNYELAKRLKIPFLPYVLTNDARTLSYPCVIKSPFGHGGKEVYWAKNEGEASAILSGEPLICQKPSDMLGRDIRVYCLGGEVLCAMERSNSKDFRSNFTLGGTCRQIQLPSILREYCSRVIGALSADFVGVDFIVDGEKYYFNEIEDVVGCRMLYHEGIDAAKLLADYVKAR